MKAITKRSLRRSAAALAIAGLSAGAVSALDLTGAGYVTYGDAQSYALALLNYQAVGGNNPGDPYYVTSTPGAIKNLTVVATGSSGTQVNTNGTGIDNAYVTPSGTSGSTFFSTATDSNYQNNAGVTGIANNSMATWDSSVASMLSFLNGQAMTFFFNNNQINSSDSSLQSLAAYAQAWITAPDGSIYHPNGGTGVFDFTNRDQAYDIVPNGGGIPNGPVSAYQNVGGVHAPIAGTNAATDYVLSGGELCVDASGNFVSCSGPYALKVNNNLGADQAAYALIVPELNAELVSLANNPNRADYTLHLSVWLGCDPSIPTDQIAETCNGQPWGRSLNNGYEQIFIQGTTFRVPEPDTLLLLGLALTGLGFTVYRKGRSN